MLPTEGGNDNQKSHMLLIYYDLRAGIPVNVKTETASMGEMRVLKEGNPDANDWSRVREATMSLTEPLLMAAIGTGDAKN